MKKKSSVLSLIICLALSAALAVSLLTLRSVRSDLAELETALAKLTAENEQLDNLNQTLKLQLDNYFLSQAGSPGTYVEEDYCSLIVDDWSAEGNVLSFDTLAQVFLTVPTDFTAKIELWRGESVYASQPVTLNPTEAATVFEAQLSSSFEIPQIDAGEELQLCLLVETAQGNTFFAYAAGWYLENGQLMIITG